MQVAHTNKTPATWCQSNPELAERGIDQGIWNALQSSIFPGARMQSVLMAWDYCTARGLDIMLKPVHIVPMSIKDAETGRYIWRDVVMPGIGLYRIQADRTGNYAGADAPEFGRDIELTFNSGAKLITPEWCKCTVHKLIGDRVVAYTAVEYWVENYATAGKDTDYPNAMWKKRPRGQLAKCAEAQALRRAWPEIGQQPTAEEMEGKFFNHAKDITPKDDQPEIEPSEETPWYPDEKFNQNFQQWQSAVLSGRQSAANIIALVESKGFQLSENQKQSILSIEQGDAA